jgi:hypothetical protein
MHFKVRSTELLVIIEGLLAIYLLDLKILCAGETGNLIRILPQEGTKLEMLSFSACPENPFPY